MYRATKVSQTAPRTQFAKPVGEKLPIEERERDLLRKLFSMSPVVSQWAVCSAGDATAKALTAIVEARWATQSTNHVTFMLTLKGMSMLGLKYEIPVITATQKQLDRSERTLYYDLNHGEEMESTREENDK